MMGEGSSGSSQESPPKQTQPAELGKHRDIKGPCWWPRASRVVSLKHACTMETRALWLLLVLATGASLVASEYVGLSPSQCQVPPKDRVDCGYPKVTQEQCNNRGCCFDSSVPQVPWCFKPLQETECTF